MFDQLAENYPICYSFLFLLINVLKVNTQIRKYNKLEQLHKREQILLFKKDR